MTTPDDETRLRRQRTMNLIIRLMAIGIVCLTMVSIIKTVLVILGQ